MSDTGGATPPIRGMVRSKARKRSRSPTARRRRTTVHSSSSSSSSSNDSYNERRSRSKKRKTTKQRRHHKLSSKDLKKLLKRSQNRTRSRRYRSRSLKTSSSTASSLERRKRSKVKPQKERRHSRSQRRRTRSCSLSGEELHKESTVLKKFLGLLGDKCNNSSYLGAHHVIALFDPKSKTQTAADWLRKVNETARIYNWNEKQVIFHAIPKLTGLAKRWYEGLSSVDLTWKEWQELILNTFPDDRNYGDKLTEMLERKSKYEESLEEYYYDKASLLNVCGITGKNAVDCIIHGIYDNNIRLNAQGSNYLEPIELLKFLRSISNRTSGQDKRTRFQGRSQSTMGGVIKPENKDYKFRRTLKCFNCSELGHTAIKCEKPLKKCNKCFRVGHEEAYCNRNERHNYLNNRTDNKTPSTSQKIQKITESNVNTVDKYVKEITINNTPYSAFIDFGSECSVIKSSVAQNMNLTVSRENLPALKGFGSGNNTLPMGSCEASVQIDGVTADIKMYIVNDELLKTDLLIGQSLTELPSVRVYKTDTDLYLYTDDTTLDKIKLYNDMDVNITGTQMIPVHSEDKISGQVYVPSCTCLQENRQYIILQGIYSLKEGCGHLIIVNISGQNITLEGEKLLSRGHRLPDLSNFKTKTTEINKIKMVTVCENEFRKTDTVKQDITAEILNIGEDIKEDEKNKLLALLNKYRECFALSPQELGLTPVTEMHIKVLDDSPISYKPYRLPFAERKIVQSMIDELLHNQIIQESQSEYASPIVLVKKKNNDYRLCVDYRALNKKTVKDRYPMPVIDDQLDRLSGNRFFTSLDLASGYHQIPVAEESRHLTAFITPDGHYEYTRMPFGLVNAPAVFQQMINKALGPKRFELAIPYLDDILTAAPSVIQCLEKLESILSLLREARLTLNITKCHFLKSSIEYLGYEISAEGLKPGLNKTQAVEKFPTPTNVHQIRQFVGLASFFRRFINDFARIARPLTSLTRTDTPWNWGLEQENAFQEIKQRLTSRPVLALYNSEYITEVHCDASKHGMGGILLQKPDEKSPLKPVAYYSRQTAKEEEFWHSYELETMAVVASLKKFRIYLIGLQFKVLTDCNALRATLCKRDLIPRIARWWLQLQEFDFTVEFRPGQAMKHADALSRNPVLNDPQPETIEIMNIRTEDWLHTVQMTDPKLKHIREILETKETDIKEITNNYAIRDNRLYRKVGKNLKWVVPNGAKWRICQLCHDESGHFGFDKTIEKMSKEYWFPKMKRFTKKYVAACMNCAYNKKATGKQSGYLHPIPKPNEIFHTMHLDHLGPFVRSKRGNMYILGVIDSFSKFIFVKGVRDTKSKTTIKTLEDIFATIGCPKIIISDQGTSFTSAEFKKYIKSIGAKHVLNAVATPRANGQIERYNRTILSSLASMNHSINEADWDLSLPKLQLSLNNTINKGIGKAPAEVVFGHRNTNPSEGTIKGILDDRNINEMQTREDIREEVKETITKQQSKMKERFDNKRAPTKFYKEGDLVMIPNINQEKGKSHKLIPKFKGPFKITAVLDHDRYEVSSIEGHSMRRYKNIFPADHLKPWITFHSSPTESERDSTASDE